jgi:hypothetical protein
MLVDAQKKKKGVDASLVFLNQQTFSLYSTKPFRKGWIRNPIPNRLTVLAGGGVELGVAHPSMKRSKRTSGTNCSVSLGVAWRTRR